MALAPSVPLALRLSVAVVLPLSAAAIVQNRGLATKDQAQPNILYFLLDDFGWGDAGWHWVDGKNPNGLQTPFLTEYAQHQGLELDRHYTWQVCSPSRSAIQSGRNPLKVNALNLKINNWNPDDLQSGFAGAPTEMTFMAEKLRDAGYETHIYGKWDVGGTSYQQLPQARGYDHSLIYFGHGNDPWKLTGGECSGKVELWNDGEPAAALVAGLGRPPLECSQDDQEGCTYQEAIFVDKVKTAIQTHTKPFFIFWSTHLVHGPYGCPNSHTASWQGKDFIESDTMLLFYGMINYLDEMFGDMMLLLKDQGEWANTLVIVHSDNGSPVTKDHAGNNYPLRGGKASNWEGGVRVPAFVTGGWLPLERRGKKSEDYITSWDWYHTLCALVGADIDDRRAENAGLAGITDSVNQLPMILGQGAQRTSIYLGQSMKAPDADDKQLAVTTTFIANQYKIIVGGEPHNLTFGELGPSQAFREGANYTLFRATCGDTPDTGCLFNIFEDITESENLAVERQDVFNEMLAQLRAHDQIFGAPFNPDRGEERDEYCEMTQSMHGDFIGPVVGPPLS